MDRVNLNNLTCNELHILCKERKISHYHGKTRFNKSEMIEAILLYESKNSINRFEYIEQADLGTIVAFVDFKGKARTAAIKEKRSNDLTLIVETEFGREFIVPYDKVLWVKKGARFPRGVYNMLKGIK